MSDTVISVEHVSKLYRLGEIGTGSLAHDVNRWWHRVRGKEDPYSKIAEGNDRSRKGDSEYVWALKDVSFEVKRGEVLGIIGRNGAGKSTLLKILSRVTTPTKGEVKVRGRIASLLEVGTGFNPEMTGRENIYLNGAILGMRKKEIDRKLDEIIDFAGVERYIDTPVKRYSSGMYVRLAFAVAAHLEPEILIVDEVLAVGDAEFQKKCLGKMKDVADHGRTVLFVSHNMAAVQTLTSSVVLVANGAIDYLGPTSPGITRYLGEGKDQGSSYSAPCIPNARPAIVAVDVKCARQNGRHVSGDPLEVQIKVSHLQPLRGACLSFQIVNQAGFPVTHSWIYDADVPICRDGSASILRCTIPSLKLNVGQHSLTVYLSEPPGGEVFEVLENICSFDVVVLERQTLFGWRPEACAYLEKFSWVVNEAVKNADLRSTESSAFSST